MSEPDLEILFKQPSTSAVYLHTDFEAEEWEQLFYHVFDCPAAANEPARFNESEEEWEERFSLQFQRAIPEYPLLGRIWDMFIYVKYRAHEVQALRGECQRVMDNTSNEKARRGLSKLIRACDEASELNYGLLLMPD